MPGVVFKGPINAISLDDLQLSEVVKTTYGLPFEKPVVEFFDFATISYDEDLVTGAPLSYDPDKLFITASYSTDVLERWYVVPSTLNLSNPRLNTDIPFFIWNTFGKEQTILDFQVFGTSSLSFDIGEGTFFTVGEYKLSNVRILPGDAAIDAVMEFTTEDGSGSLSIIAALADTFNLIPEIPVREIWSYKTEVFISHNGTEQRHSLISNPRISISFTTLIQDEKQRKANFNLLYNNIQFESLVPFYQYATNPTQDTLLGDSKIFLDMKRTNFRIDIFAVIVNPEDLSVIIARVTDVQEDGIVIATSVTQRITSKWVAAPAINSLISNGSGFTMSSVSGLIKVDSESMIEPEVRRPNAIRNIDFFDGLPHLNRRPLVTAEEAFSFRREVIDNEVGRRIIKSSDPHPSLEGTRSFEIQRVTDPDEMDYWRDFCDKTRGNFRSFLFSTWLTDLTESQPIVPEFAVIEVLEGFYASSYFPFDTFKRIQIEYSDGSFSFHKVISVNETPEGTCQLSILPPTPNFSPTVFVKKISYLLKYTGSDTITLEHNATTTRITLQIKSTDY